MTKCANLIVQLTQWIRARVSFLDMLMGSCVVAALATGLACYIAPGTKIETAGIPDARTYYPVAYPEKVLTAQAPGPIIDVIPAQAAPAPAPVRQLARSGKGFRSWFGEQPIERMFEISDWNTTGSFYGGRWAPENAVVTRDGLELQVKREPKSEKPFSLAEIRSKQSVGYGRYEAVMQIGKGAGLVSGFFTYTGPHAGNPHDEIDIEFLGKDPSKIQFNYWHKGKRGKYATFDLPFDASAAPHLYAFEWLPDRITWYVDGVAYYSTEPDDAFIPQTAGQLYFSHWTGTPKMRGWHGTPDFASSSATIVSCTSFTPANDHTATCGDSFRPILDGPADNQVFATLSP